MTWITWLVNSNYISFFKQIWAYGKAEPGMTTEKPITSVMEVYLEPGVFVQALVTKEVENTLSCKRSPALHMYL